MRKSENSLKFDASFVSVYICLRTFVILQSVKNLRPGFIKKLKFQGKQIWKKINRIEVLPCACSVERRQSVSCEKMSALKRQRQEDCSESQHK